MCLSVGVACGLAASLLKWLINYVSDVVRDVSGAAHGNAVVIALPIIGVMFTVVFSYYVMHSDFEYSGEKIKTLLRHGDTAISPKLTYGTIIANALTLGFGGSAGVGGPIANVGASLGSNISRRMGLSDGFVRMMIWCGSAAGVAGIFKAPLSGALFTLEVLMIDLTTVTVMPLLIASVSAATVAYVFTGYDSQFFFVQSEPFVTSRIPYAILLGVLCGFASLYFIRIINSMENFYGRINNPWVRASLGGAILAGLIFFFPPLYGEGYSAITAMLHGDVGSIVDGSIFYNYRNSVWFIILFVGALCMSKAFATSSTNGAGGVGGTFAPSLYMGVMTGFFFAYLINALDFGPELSVKNFALLGMCGVMAGVMHAPLMGIFLTAELTGGYELFLPLLIVATISYGTIKIFEPYSIYAIRLAKRGELLTHHKDKSVLRLLKINSVIENDFKPVRPEMSLKEMVDVISQSNRNLFPVTDADGKLLGVVLLDDIRNIMFRPDLYRRMYVSKFMSSPPAMIEIGDTMENVMKTFDRTGAWNLPVVENGVYMGFVSKSKIFNSYRRVLRHYSED
jgi:CIC family chloride channel protein